MSIQVEQCLLEVLLSLLCNVLMPAAVFFKSHIGISFTKFYEGRVGDV